MPLGIDKSTTNDWMYQNKDVAKLEDKVEGPPKQIIVNPDRISYPKLNKHEVLFNEMMAYYKSISTKNICNTDNDELNNQTKAEDSAALPETNVHENNPEHSPCVEPS
jgi:hypothetical protein